MSAVAVSSSSFSSVLSAPRAVAVPPAVRRGAWQLRAGQEMWEMGIVIDLNSAAGRDLPAACQRTIPNRFPQTFSSKIFGIRSNPLELPQFAT